MSPSHSVFNQPKPERRTKMLTVRVTATQDGVLNKLAAVRNCDRAELVRQALDFWLAAGPPTPEDRPA